MQTGWYGSTLIIYDKILETLDCYGIDKIFKFAEIVADKVLAGEISLAAAIPSLDGVSSHEQMGRNDPGKS